MSSDNVIQGVLDFKKQIDSLFPGVRIDLETFSSEAYMLNIRWCDRLFALDYSSSQGFFSVYEVTENYGFLVAPYFATQDFDRATHHLKRLLDLACHDS